MNAWSVHAVNNRATSPSGVIGEHARGYIAPRKCPALSPTRKQQRRRVVLCWVARKSDREVTLAGQGLLSVLGLEGDLDALARDDKAGRLLQDQALPVRRRRGLRALVSVKSLDREVFIATQPDLSGQRRQLDRAPAQRSEYGRRDRPARNADINPPAVRRSGTGVSGDRPCHRGVNRLSLMRDVQSSVGR